MANGLFDEKQPITSHAKLTDSTDVNPQGVLTSAAGGPCRIDALSAVTDSAADLVLFVWTTAFPYSLVNFYPIGSVTIPAGAGMGAVPAVDVLAGLPLPWQSGFPMMAGEDLVVSLQTALAAGKSLWVCAYGGEL